MCNLIKDNKPNIGEKLKTKDRIILISPLLISILLFMTINHYRSYNGLWLNLATEFAGIVVTIIYIEYVIDRNNQKKWKPINENIQEMVLFYTNSLLTSLRSAQGHSEYQFQEDSDAVKNKQKSNLESTQGIIEYYKKIVLPNQEYAFLNLNENEWNTLISDWDEVRSESLNCQKMYNAVLDSKHIEILMYITKSLSWITKFYNVWSDIIPIDSTNINKYGDGTADVRINVIENLQSDMNELIDYLNIEISNLNKLNKIK